MQTAEERQRDERFLGVSMITKTCLGLAFGFAVIAACPPALSGADKQLFGFQEESSLKNVTLQDASVSIVKRPGGAALRITTGEKQAWPGVALRAPEGHWDLSSFSHVTLTVRNAGPHKVAVSCRVDGPGADGTRNCVTDSVTLAPGQTDTLRVTLKRNHEGKLGGKL